jgi:flagellar secretion chaperone FliS
MTRYAMALGRDPGATYRQVDIAGRASTDGHGLVQLLYDELLAALRSAAWATEHKQFKVKSDKVTRATAILFALEAGLDFEKGGELSHTLARLYVGARQKVLEASIDGAPAAFLDIAKNLDEIAAAWRSVRNG